MEAGEVALARISAGVRYYELECGGALLYASCHSRIGRH